tara:strand:+ start:66 stop:473 length:408 start_codon:yes stop_codon:yes gene_type:complete
MEITEFLKEVDIPETFLEDNGDKEKTHIVIDLNMANGDAEPELITEFFGVFANITNWLLKTTLGIDFKSWSIPVSFKGSRSQLSSFEKAFKGERKYMRAAKKYGLDNPRTYKSKYGLERSIRNFEKTTGMKWPIE